MTTNRNLRLTRAVKYALGLGFAAALTTNTAFAAEEGDEAAELERVQVTGTRLTQIQIEGANPVTVIGRDDLNRVPYDSVGQLLQSMPSMSGSPVNTFTNNGGNGATAVDLRGLGSVRTLVLINGRRADFAGDLNSFPIAMVERIEVLKEGASAIYGADAVAGVVNIITRSDFEGMELSVTFNDWAVASAPTTRVSGITGGNSERGNFVIGFDFVEQEEIFQDALDPVYMDFPITVVDGDDYRANGLVVGQNAVILGSSSTAGGFFYGDIDNDGDIDDESYTLNYTFTGTGTDLCTGADRDYEPADSIANFHLFGTGSCDSYNFNPDNYMQTPNKRISFFLQGNYAINSNLTAFMEAQFQRRESEQFLAPLPYFADVGDPGFPITTGALAGFNGVSADNFYNPFGADVTARRRVVEFGGRRFFQTRDAYRMVLGVNGLIADRWNYEISHNYSETQRTDTDFGQFYGPRMELALGPSFEDADGNIVCGTPGNVIAGCVPLNLFGGPGTITQEMIEYVGLAMNDRIDSRTDVLHASIAGDLFEMPAGWMQGAFGVERRREKFRSVPDSSKVNDVATGNTGAITEGSKQADSMFLEFAVPLLADAPLVESLNLTAGFRQDDFDAFDSADSYNIGLKWQPINDILVRATVGESFREPTIGDLFAGQADSFPTADDLCGGAADFASLTPEQQQNCIDDGVPAGGWNDSAIVQIRSRVGGNPNVQPEEGESLTVGIVWSPDALPGFSAILDYWDFEVTNTISALATQTILDNCALEGLDCDLIDRLPNGQIVSVTALQDNLGTLTATGIDLEFNYSHGTGFGDFDHRLMITQLTERTFQESAAAPVANLEGQFDNTFIGDSSFPETRLIYTADWLMGQFGASARLEYISSMEDNNDPSLGTLDVDAVTYLDLTGHWYLNTGTTLDLGITNVTDEDPPYINAAFNSSVDESIHRVMGTGYFVRVTQRFD